MKKNTTATLLGGIAIVGLLLTGCAGGGNSGDDSKSGGSSKDSSSSNSLGKGDGGSATSTQSKTEACTILTSELTKASETLTSSVSDMVTNPDNASSAMNEYSQAFKTAIGKISNEEVKTQAEAIDKSLDALVAALGDASTNPQAVIDASESFQKEMAKVADVCTP